MGRSEIADMDVIANAGAIRRVVVGAENRNAAARAECGLQHQGNEVRFGIVLLAKFTF